MSVQRVMSKRIQLAEVVNQASHQACSSHIIWRVPLIQSGDCPERVEVCDVFEILSQPFELPCRKLACTRCVVEWVHEWTLPPVHLGSPNQVGWICLWNSIILHCCLRKVVVLGLVVMALFSNAAFLSSPAVRDGCIRALHSNQPSSHLCGSPDCILVHPSATVMWCLLLVSSLWIPRSHP